MAVRSQLFHRLIYSLLAAYVTDISHPKASISCVFAVFSLKSTFFPPSTLLQVMVDNPCFLLNIWESSHTESSEMHCGHLLFHLASFLLGYFRSLYLSFTFLRYITSKAALLPLLRSDALLRDMLMSLFVLHRSFSLMNEGVYAIPPQQRGAGYVPLQSYPAGMHECSVLHFA